MSFHETLGNPLPNEIKYTPVHKPDPLADGHKAADKLVEAEKDKKLQEAAEREEALIREAEEERQRELDELYSDKPWDDIDPSHRDSEE